MKLIFLGTPEFAVKPLLKLLSSRHKVVAVITQPDKINGRNNRVSFSPVKETAILHNIPVYQFNKISAEGVETLKSLCADIMVTCAYGQILSQEVLDLCPYGVVNIHASLLPKYRGSSPVQWAILNGDKILGVTVMQTALRVDSGDMLIKKELTLDCGENTSEALDKLSVIGAESIVEALDGLENGTLIPIPQDESQATFCKMLKKEDGAVDFNKKSSSVTDFIRGMTPWPSAFVFCKYGRLKIIKAEEYFGAVEGNPKEIVFADKKEGLVVKCAEGAVKIITVQGENAKAMPAKDYLLGHPMQKGSVFCE